MTANGWRPEGEQPAVILCIYCQRGRHDQCVSHRTGFPFCICPASLDATEPMTLRQARAA